MQCLLSGSALSSRHSQTCSVGAEAECMYKVPISAGQTHEERREFSSSTVSPCKQPMHTALDDSFLQHTYKEHGGLLKMHAQVLSEAGFFWQLFAEGRPDGQAMHCDLVFGHSHGKCPLLGFLCCHKAPVHILVEPGVMTCCEVCHYCCKFDVFLSASPAKHVNTTVLASSVQG